MSLKIIFTSIYILIIIDEQLILIKQNIIEKYVSLTSTNKV